MLKHKGRYRALAWGTVNSFYKLFSSFDHPGFGRTSKGHSHSVEALSSKQRSPSCLSAQETVLYRLSLSRVSDLHSNPENSTFLGLFWGVYCCFSNPHLDTRARACTHTQQEVFCRLMTRVKLSWNSLPSLRSKSQTESCSPALSNPPTHKGEEKMQSKVRRRWRVCILFKQFSSF